MELPVNIRTGKGECIQFLIESTSTPASNECESLPHSFYFGCGLLPDKMIERYQKEGEIKDAEWYDGAFSDKNINRYDMGERWSLKIPLQDGALLDKNILDRSNIIRIRDVYYSSEKLSEVSEVIDSVYKGLSTPD